MVGGLQGGVLLTSSAHIMRHMLCARHCSRNLGYNRGHKGLRWAAPQRPDWMERRELASEHLGEGIPSRSQSSQCTSRACLACGVSTARPVWLEQNESEGKEVRDGSKVTANSECGTPGATISTWLLL